MSKTSIITIRPKPDQQTKGLLRLDSLIFPCALGRSGLNIIKREGDGATPILVTRPLYGFYRPDRERRPISPLHFIPSRSNMGWCDTPDHASYNRQVQLPFNASHESLQRDDPLYDLVVVLDINIKKRIKGAGSALFMHVARKGYQPTEGCIALEKRDLRHLLKHMSNRTLIRITR